MFYSTIELDGTLQQGFDRQGSFPSQEHGGCSELHLWSSAGSGDEPLVHLSFTESLHTL